MWTRIRRDLQTSAALRRTGISLVEAMPWLRIAGAVAVLGHLDGTGYPDGLRGTRIPLEARIVRVADAFDAMTHDRPYQKGRSFEDAIEELRRCAGTQFDPELVALTVALLTDGSSLRTRIATHHRTSPVLLHRTGTVSPAATRAYSEAAAERPTFGIVRRP